MTVSAKTWSAFVKRLAGINAKAGAEMRAYIAHHGLEDTDALIRYAYALATKYGEASAALAAEMYDAIAALSGASLPPAVVAPTAAYGDTAAAMYATAATGSPEQVAAAIERLVKLPGADTMLYNAIRDRAEFAWIPSGDTCAFCIALASWGWREASETVLKGGHAEHIHGNCDCMFMVRHDHFTEVEGYDDGRRYREMYKDVPLDEWNTPDGKPPAGHESAEKESARNRVNALRRKFYGQNTKEINEQKRSAYEKRRERESSAAEELDV